jgi:mannosyl-3-phosphoglycerate phosphatase
MPHKFILFTDLDGTLLDHDTYSFDEALPALRLLEKENIPLVINTSKPRGEIERYRSLLGNRHPFISENGGGIFIPDGYFSQKFRCDRTFGGYLVIEPGTPRETLRDVLRTVASETGIHLRGISDMSLPEIMEATGLDEESALLATERSYSEPFLIIGGDEGEVVRKIAEKGYNYTRGSRFHHILGENDKGKAVRILTGIYRYESPSVETLGVGDSLNDLPMLKEVDYPVLVRKRGGYDSGCLFEKLILADGEGPSGFNSAILKFFIRFGEKLSSENRI